ncbi:hypothetical protein [Lishizhenia sp.]|uniref:hypothetical protein n=1 Tax=Lishizhenia sp. TaxID=2497594 RepID=UPI00299DE9D6|nr:hypothetical protein [Lishizhenia sp.]MDX1447250.1 hypothetical protein [Lishizhenia sp.]
MSKKVKDKRRAKLKAARKMSKLKENKSVLFRCLGCGAEEMIPIEVVEELDFFDGGDLSVPPRFSCENCPEQMEPVLYKSVHGVTYKWKD